MKDEKNMNVKIVELVKCGNNAKHFCRTFFVLLLVKMHLLRGCL